MRQPCIHVSVPNTIFTQYKSQYPTLFYTMHAQYLLCLGNPLILYVELLDVWSNEVISQSNTSTGVAAPLSAAPFLFCQGTETF